MDIVGALESGTLSAEEPAQVEGNRGQLPRLSSKTQCEVARICRYISINGPSLNSESNSSIQQLLMVLVALATDKQSQTVMQPQLERILEFVFTNSFVDRLEIILTFVQDSGLKWVVRREDT